MRAARPDAGAAAAVALCLLAAGCSSGKEPPPGIGRAVFSGPVRALSASADGAWLAFLDRCADVRAQALPPQTASCDLRVVATGGGEARRIAGAVTTLPHAVSWAPSGDVLAAVSEYDYTLAAGRLVLSKGGGPAEPVAEEVTFHGLDPRGGAAGVGAVARGRLVAKVPGAPPEVLPGLEGLASFEVHPAAAGLPPGRVAVLGRQAVSAGGALVGIRRTPPRGEGPSGPAPVSRLAERAGDYAFAPRGEAFAFTALGADGYELWLSSRGGAPARLGDKVHGFSFSADGSALAFVGGAEPGTQGDLLLTAVDRPSPAAVAREVGELRWARGAARLAWLERYDPRVRAGTLGAGGPGLAPRTFAPNVSDFDISPDGEHLAFLQHTTRGGYSVDLGLAHLAAPREAKPSVVARGVFGFSFSPDGRWLYYRTRCVRNAEACDLERVPAAGAAPGAPPEAVAQGVKSFEFDPRRPGRLLVTWQRMDMVALDVAVWEDGKLTAVDTAVLPGSARFLGPDSRRMTYAVAHPKRQGVYVAELPR